MDVEKCIEERLAKAVEKGKQSIRKAPKRKVVLVDTDKVMADNSSQGKTSPDPIPSLSRTLGTTSPDLIAGPSRHHDEPPSRSLSHASSGSERSRAESIHSRVSHKSLQGEFTATRAQSRTAISRGQKATAWESSDKDSEEEGAIYDPTEEQRQGYVPYTLSLNKRKWGVKKGIIELNKRNIIENITIKNITIKIGKKIKKKNEEKINNRNHNKTKKKKDNKII
jgi:hypothetical protein